MGGQNKVSTVRVYRATDGTLVGENDPRAASLAYPVGGEIPAERVREYDEFMARADGAEADPAGDPKDRAEMRARVAPQGSGPGTYAQPIGEKLATELADEAQDIANSDVETRVAAAKAADSDRVVAEFRVGRTEDGELVRADDPRSAYLAYGAGDEIQDPAHKDAYSKLSDAPDADEGSDVDSDSEHEQPPADPVVTDPAKPKDDEGAASTATGTKAASTPANKAGKAAGDKAANQ